MTLILTSWLAFWHQKMPIPTVVVAATACFMLPSGKSDLMELPTTTTDLCEMKLDNFPSFSCGGRQINSKYVRRCTATGPPCHGMRGNRVQLDIIFFQGRIAKSGGI